MDDWAKEFYKAMETVAGEVDRMFQDVFREIDDWVDEWIEVSDDFSSQIEETLRSVLPIDEITAELDRYVQESIEPLVNFYSEFDRNFEQWSEDSDPFIPVTYVHPSADQNPACIGCQHYHGQTYGNNLLVCGMHPYGWEGGVCPDWESDSLN